VGTPLECAPIQIWIALLAGFENESLTGEHSFQVVDRVATIILDESVTPAAY
jgi:hypothetical protein